MKRLSTRCVVTAPVMIAGLTILTAGGAGCAAADVLAPFGLAGSSAKSAPQAGGRAEASVPGWCSVLGTTKVEGSGGIEHALNDEDPRNALKDLVGYMCTPDAEVAAHMTEFETARRKWSQRLDLTEADWADVAVYATLGQGERMYGTVRINTDPAIGRSPRRAWSSYDALDQYATIIYDLRHEDDLATDHDYFVDALGPRLTELGRFAYVKGCINGKIPVQWAMCQGDVARLDLKKLATELRANKVYSGADKMQVRIQVNEFKPTLVAHAGEVKSLIARDPGYRQIFEMADASLRDWEGLYRTDTALIALAATMDDARATNSHRAAAGCEDKIWPAWKEALATIPAKTFEGIHHDHVWELAFGPMLNTPRVYLAAVALTTCAALAQDRTGSGGALIAELGARMLRWPGARGPRTATETAIMTAGVTLDDSDARLEYPKTPYRDFRGGGRSPDGGGSGVVSSVAPSGKSVTITFKKQMFTEIQCAEFKETKHLLQIRRNGELVYDQICVRNETVTWDKASPPQTVSARFAEGIKPGMFVSVKGDMATAAWDKPGAPVPTLIFGVPLK